VEEVGQLHQIEPAAPVSVECTPRQRVIAPRHARHLSVLSCLTDLFTIKELEALDQKQLDILKDALVSEIRTSTEINKILKKSLRTMYDDLARSKR
jgi:hypothetical protein